MRVYCVIYIFVYFIQLAIISMFAGQTALGNFDVDPADLDTLW